MKWNEKHSAIQNELKLTNGPKNPNTIVVFFVVFLFNEIKLSIGKAGEKTSSRPEEAKRDKKKKKKKGKRTKSIKRFTKTYYYWINIVSERETS